jgi:hypothetical protein
MSVISQSRWRRFREVRRMACMANNTNAYTVAVENPERRNRRFFSSSSSSSSYSSSSYSSSSSMARKLTSSPGPFKNSPSYIPVSS